MVWIIHLIYTEYGLQTTFIERFIMCHKWQPLYQRLYLRPDLREYWSILCIFLTKAMYLATPIILIVRLRLDERIECIYDFAIANNDNPHRTNTTTLVIGCFKIYSCKVSHDSVLPNIPPFVFT